MNTPGHRFCRGTVRNTLCVALCVALYAVWPVAQAQAAAATESLRQYEIPTGPLSATLSAWGAQSDRQLVFAPDLIAGKQGRGISGRYNVEQALTQLLAGTGLTWERVDGQTYALKRVSQRPAKKNEEVAAATLKTVEVSASRISRPDLTIPTPQVPIPRQTLNLDVQTNVGAALLDLPYFRGSVTPQTGGPNGGIGNSGVDIRGLGTVRTLTLLDGQRFVGDNDLNNVPSILVKRVDIVTGGASATWGSGAVAGVVNIILDHELQGVKLDSAMGISSDHDALERKDAIAAGTSYADGKGHVVFGFNYVDRGMVYPANRDSRYQTPRWALVPIGNGVSQILPDTGNVNHAPGGSITTGVLKGQVFNPDGTLSPNPYGTPVSGSTSSGFGAPNTFDTIAFVAPVKFYSALASTDYKINDNLKFTASLQNSRQWGNYPKFLISQNNIPISIDNAFLPQQVKQIMLENGEASFLMGRLNEDINQVYNDFTRGETQATLGLDGSIGSWHWSTYISEGKLSDTQNQLHHLIVKNFSNAVDSVIDSSTNLPVCRVTLTDPSSNCVPINIIGLGNVSQAALDYVTGSDLSVQKNILRTASASVQGEPWELPAGFVSVAGGIEWRSESQNTWVPQSQVDDPTKFELSNTPPLHGQIHVTEAFGEILLPLLADRPGFQDLAMDIAGRASDYSTSGEVGSWKIGFVDGMGAGFRARLDFSRDIRAPEVSELYASQSTSLNQFVDPVKNVQVLGASISGGNPNLQPETAKTLTAGISWSPPAISNLAFSLDYFNINATNIISSLGAVTILQQCVAGNEALCSRITRDADGNLISVSTQLINLAQYKTDGVDLDMSYQRPVTIFGVPGTLSVRTLGTWTHRLLINDGVNTLSFVGDTSGGSTAGSFGGPRWKGILTPSFDSKKFSLYGRLRYISSGYYDRHQNIINNDVGNYFYTDVGGAYKFGPDGKASIYLDITNATNKQPPHGSTASFSSYYDAMGRYYTLGFRLNL